MRWPARITANTRRPRRLNASSGRASGAQVRRKASATSRAHPWPSPCAGVVSRAGATDNLRKPANRRSEDGSVDWLASFHICLCLFLRTSFWREGAVIYSPFSEKVSRVRFCSASQTAICDRELNPSFVKMCSTWVSAVRCETTNVLAISLFDRP